MKYGQTPLIVACVKGHTDCVSVLLGVLQGVMCVCVCVMDVCAVCSISTQ